MRNDVLVSEEKYFTNKKSNRFIYTMFTTNTARYVMKCSLEVFPILVPRVSCLCVSVKVML